MRTGRLFPMVAAVVAVASVSCIQTMESPLPADNAKKKVGFDIQVTRDGKQITPERRGIMTKNSPLIDTDDQYATMDAKIPFGLMGIDDANNALVVNNAMVSHENGTYNTYLDPSFWESLGSSTLALSAYYPYVSEVTFNEDSVYYSIPYSIDDTNAGPLVSKTVKMAVDLLDMVPLEFQHITNDIGFRICDVTPTPELQGLIHLRKMIAYNVASAGIFRNDMAGSKGLWHRQGYYRNVLVFEGDAKLGVGSKNELFVGYDSLVDRMADSHRYYSIPDEIVYGKQCVDVFFDVDGFTIDGYDYAPLTDQVARFMFYGLLPDNVFEYGKQYTFHIGIDLSNVYHEICFAASIAGWENKIYENNDDF